MDFFNFILSPDNFTDFCPNGIQVDGTDNVKSILFAVSATHEVIDEAVNYDMLVVHHGIFWKGDTQSLTGPKFEKVSKLIKSGTSLVAYHLPLDANDAFGNNIGLLSDLFGVDSKASAVIPFADISFGINVDIGHNKLSCLLADRFGDTAGINLGRTAGGKDEFKKVAVCTGAGQSLFKKAIDEGYDAFITGEGSLTCELMAKDYGVAYYACGHHATEKYGVISLMENIRCYSSGALDVSFYDDGCLS